MPVWKKIVEVLNPKPEHISQAANLLAEVRTQGYSKLTNLELLSLKDEVIAVFFNTIMDGKVPVSPVAHCTDSSWMSETDFCFLNVRATGLSEGQFGTFIQASKLLLGIRAGAIHLAPFTDYEFGTIYAVRSFKTIASQVVDKTLAAGGVPAARQLDAFVQAAHALGKAVGFDLEPHAAQYAVPVLEVPEAFRWIKVFPEDRQWLDYMLKNDTVFTREVQERLSTEVRTLVGKFLKDKSLHTFDEEENDTPEVLGAKRKAYQECVSLLIKEGYWTVPVHSWDSEGLPQFQGYNTQDNYAQFLYHNRQGQDSSSYAYHIVTPFLFYHHLPLQGTMIRQKPEINPAGLDLFCSVFLHWRDRHHFDFVRHDSVDHIFDSIFDGDGNWPMSDRPTPFVLTEFIRRSKLPGKPFVGHLAERMGNEIEDYQAIGYDVLLGSDMMEMAGPAHLEKSFRLQGQLELLNLRRKSPFAISYALDTHDTGNPHLWGQSMLEKVGPEGLKLRLFLSRFLGWGKARRPKYEVMGLSDLSTGLFPANVSEKNLNWAGQKDFTAYYHKLEDTYGSLKADLAVASMDEGYVGTNYAWWLLSTPQKVIILAAWYEGAGAFSETGMETSVLEEKYSAKPGEFPFPLKELSSKTHGNWNTKALEDRSVDPCCGIWVIPKK